MATARLCKGRTCMHVHMHAHTHTHTCAHTHTLTHKGAHTHTSTYTHTHIPIQLHPHAHPHTHAFIATCTEEPSNKHLPILEMSLSCSLSDTMLQHSVSTMVSTWNSFTLFTRGPRLQQAKNEQGWGLAKTKLKENHTSGKAMKVQSAWKDQGHDLPKLCRVLNIRLKCVKYDALETKPATSICTLSLLN